MFSKIKIMTVKICYVICRQSALFSLPGLRNIKNYFYAKHLDTNDIYVDDFVRIGPAHKTLTINCKIGDGLRVGRNVEIDTCGGILIGKRVTVSEDAKIYTHDHVIQGGHVNWRENGLKTSSLIIEDDAWIGANAIILQSVNRIGRGAVIASGSIVRYDVNDLTIVAGNPAAEKKIRDCI